jgi:hypothetical protein
MKANKRPLAKESQAYVQLSRQIKRKELLALRDKKHSLGMFIGRLTAIGRANIGNA